MNNLSLAIQASVKAGIEILKVYDEQEQHVENKADNSPLTKADIASNKIINRYLSQTPIPIISEENKQLPYEERKHWDICWIVDPLDGTKEFIKRNGEFTVNIALVEKGVPKLGVIYVPVSRELYYADVLQGRTYKKELDINHESKSSFINADHEISPQALKDVLRVVGSRSHMNKETSDFIESLKKENGKVEIVSKGSSLKFCLVAEGKADIYPRFAPTMEWDTAAGHAICKASGLNVISKDTGEELLYNKENLLNGHFVVKK